jgi:hypothetical protein
MAGITVISVSIADLLTHLQEREWLCPKFQREFVWTEGQIEALVTSVLNAHPIGMVTLWAQPDGETLELEPVSLSDATQTGIRFFTSKTEDAKKKYAILDGRQRSTALAMAFGGFQATDRRYKFAGKYFLNVACGAESDLVQFISDRELEARNLGTPAAQISAGLFALSPPPNVGINEQWMEYLASIRQPHYYTTGSFPGEEELTARENILKTAFNGIIKTKIAVYIVPEKYDLGEICEIFETLNTTGTRVSTVDLIHSWLYADTIQDSTGPTLLREWIKEFGDRDGAIGWSETKRRPELMAQLVTACHVALDSKPPPRQVGGRTSRTAIASVKAGDLLATPSQHWKNVIENEVHLAGYIGDLQDLVAGGRFSWSSCPYPVSASIYVALRWHHRFDSVTNWGVEELNAIYRAFFWRNALMKRYDQGFLTQLGADLKEIKSILQQRPKFQSAANWCSFADEQLINLMGPGIPDHDAMIDMITDGRLTGAIQKALHLLLIARPKTDLVNQNIVIKFPQNQTAELHHIYPKSWCSNNVTGDMAALLNKSLAGKDWVNSCANLMLLSRESNNEWKAKHPGQVLIEKQMDFSPLSSIFESLFIDKMCFDSLSKGAIGLDIFWRRRAELIASELLRLKNVSL